MSRRNIRNLLIGYLAVQKNLKEAAESWLWQADGPLTLG
jgi:hypothetical protein